MLKVYYILIASPYPGHGPWGLMSLHKGQPYRVLIIQVQMVLIYGCQDMRNGNGKVDDHGATGALCTLCSRAKMMQDFAEHLIIFKKYFNKFDFDLFGLMLYLHGKQLMSCRDSQLLSNTIPGQACKRQFTVIG